MNIHYTGKLEIPDTAARKKLDLRFARLSKLLDRKSEKEAHVILTSERHLHKAEITVNFYDHTLVCAHSSTGQVLALTSALDKLEKQLLRLHDKKIAGKRRGGKSRPAEETPAEDEPAASPRIFKVNSRSARKPMTVEEAVLELDNRNYVVYLDAGTARLSVLIRRPDGHFDLIEA